jgi:glycerol-3-phosphate dehydrogenase
MGANRAAVCVIGGGVVGAAVTLELARRGVEVVLVEAEPALALAASGTNSGILHTGFDSSPGTLETRLIRRSAELRDETLGALGVPMRRCGAEVRPSGGDRDALGPLVERARHNGVPVEVLDDRLIVPGEAVTDPVRHTLALARAAEGFGATIVCSTRVERIQCGEEVVVGGRGGEIARCRAAVNCAGLHADEVARAAGDDHFRIVPRKGEFVVFEPGPGGMPIDRILLPVPTGRTKGVLVFPTIDGKVVAGPTARDQEDKRDWRVAPEAEQALIEEARERVEALRDCEPIASYAGLRPAGADGVNYLIERSRACPRLVHVAAIRSTGLSACLGIAEHVAGLLQEAGIVLGVRRPISPVKVPAPDEPWWRRSAEYWT